MAQVKNYGLIGGGSNFQLGKNGPKLVGNADTGSFSITNEGGVITRMSGANAVNLADFVTKAQLDSVSADALVSDIEYNSGTVTMGNITAGTKTIQTVFSVDTVFDGNSEIKVGTDSTNDLLLSTNYYDLTTAGDYVTINTVELATDTQIKVFVTQGNSTVGNGTIVVSVLDGPVTGSSAGGSSYGDGDVATLLSSFGSNSISTSGDITSTGVLKLDQVGEKLQSKSITSAGTFTFQCANGQVFYVSSPAGNWTCNFTDLAAPNDYATAATIVISQGATPYMPTGVAIGGSGATINWQGGSAPTGTANSIDVVTFSIINVGGTYTVLGQATTDFS